MKLWWNEIPKSVHRVQVKYNSANNEKGQQKRFHDKMTLQKLFAPTMKQTRIPTNA